VRWRLARLLLDGVVCAVRVLYMSSARGPAGVDVSSCLSVVQCTVNTMNGEQVEQTSTGGDVGCLGRIVTVGCPGTIAPAQIEAALASSCLQAGTVRSAA
jgi:hypothetical protein